MDKEKKRKKKIMEEKLIKKHHRKQDDKHFKFFEDLERAKTLLKIGEKN